MATFTGGTVYLQVVPSFQGVASRIAAESATWGSTSGTAFTRSFNTALRGINNTAPGPSAAAGAKSGTAAGVAYNGAFDRALRSGVAKAQASLPTLKIDAALNASAVDREIEHIREQTARLSDLTIGVDIDATTFNTRLDALIARASAIDGRTLNVDVRADIAAYLAEMAAAKEAADKLDGRNVEVNVRADASSLDSFTGRLRAVLQVAALVGPALVPVGAAIAGVAGAAAGIGAIGAAGFGSVALGLSGISDAVKEVQTQQQTAGATALKSAQQQSQAANQVVNSQRAIKDSEDALANARASAAVAEQKAQKSIADARESASRAATAAAQSIQRAVDDEARAEENAARQSEQAARAVQDAQQSLADTRQSASRSIASALKSEAAAEKQVAAAQKDSLQAQLDLNEARKDAAEQLEDLSNRLTDSILDERQAELDLADAQDRVNKLGTDDQKYLEYQNELADAKKRLASIQSVADNGGVFNADAAREAAADVDRYQKALDGLANDDDPVRAQLALEQAQQRVNEVQLETKRLTAENTDAQKKGVAGSDLVVAAQQRIADAQDAQVAAQDNLKDATQSVADAQQDAAESIARAQQQVADAMSEQARTQADSAASIQDAQAAIVQAQLDGAQSVSDAQDRVNEAIANAAEQQRQSAYSVAQAEEGVTKAHEAAAAAAVAAAAASAPALASQTLAYDGLTQAGKNFVDLLTGKIIPEINRLKGIAQENLLPGLGDGLLALQPLFPVIEKIVANLSKAFGDLAAEAGKALAGPAFRPFFDYIATKGAPIITKLGEAFGYIALAVANLVTAFAPVTDIVVDAILQFAKSLADFTKGDGFTKFVQYAVDNLPALGELLKDLVKAGLALLIAFAPLGPILLEMIDGFVKLIAAIPPKVLFVIVSAIVALVATLAVAAGSLPVIITLVALIVGGFVALYEKSELVRKSLDAFFDFFKHPLAGIENFGKWIIDGMFLPFEDGGYINKKITAFKDMVVGFFKSLFGIHSPSTVFAELGASLVDGLLSAFDGIGDKVGGAFSAVVGALQTVWFNVTKTVWDPVWTFLSDTLPGWFKSSVGWVYDKFNDVGNKIQAAWSNAYNFIWVPIYTFLSDTLPGWFKSAVGWIYDKFNDIGNQISRAWSNAYNFIWVPIWAFLSSTLPGWFASAVGWVYDKFNAVGGKISDAWENAKAYIWTPIHDFMTQTVPGYFSDAVTLIGRAWDGLKEMAKAPIRFVVNTVFNQGLVPAFNAIVGVFSDKYKINPVSLPPEFATGGHVGGYSPNKRADNIHAMLTAGEFVQPVDTVQYYGADFMEALRTRKLPRGLLPGFASGGLIALGKKFQQLGARVSENPAFGGVAPVHAKNSLHYSGDAIDVNTRPGESKAEQQELAPLAAMAQDLGFRVIFMESGHYDHLHVDTGRKSESLLGKVGDFISGVVGSIGDVITDPVGSLTNAVSDKLGGIGTSQWAHALADMPGYVISKLGEGIKGLMGSVGDFIGGGGDVGPSSSVKAVVQSVANGYGWGSGAEWNALQALVNKESSFNPTAQNKTSTAYGLFQFLNGTWGTVGARKTSDPAQQTVAGLKYIQKAYGDPVKAWAFHQSHNWYADGGQVAPAESPTLYDQGGILPPGLTTVYNGTKKPETVFTFQQMQDMKKGNRGSGYVINQTQNIATDNPERAAQLVNNKLRDTVSYLGLRG